MQKELDNLCYLRFVFDKSSAGVVREPVKNVLADFAR